MLGGLGFCGFEVARALCAERRIDSLSQCHQWFFSNSSMRRPPETPMVPPPEYGNIGVERSFTSLTGLPLNASGCWPASPAHPVLNHMNTTIRSTPMMLVVCPSLIELSPLRSGPTLRLPSPVGGPFIVFLFLSQGSCQQRLLPLSD